MLRVLMLISFHHLYFLQPWSCEPLLLSCLPILHCRMGQRLIQDEMVWSLFWLALPSSQMHVRALQLCSAHRLLELLHSPCSLPRMTGALQKLEASIAIAVAEVIELTDGEDHPMNRVGHWDSSSLIQCTNIGDQWVTSCFPKGEDAEGASVAGGWHVGYCAM